MASYCAVCGKKASGHVRSNWRTCSPACRKAWQRHKDDIKGDLVVIENIVAGWVDDADTMFKIKYVVDLMFCLYNIVVKQFARANEKAAEKAKEQGRYWGIPYGMDALYTALRRNGE